MPGMTHRHDHKWEAYIVGGTLASGAAILLLLLMLLKDWARVLAPLWNR